MYSYFVQRKSLFPPLPIHTHTHTHSGPLNHSTLSPWPVTFINTVQSAFPLCVCVCVCLRLCMWVSASCACSLRCLISFSLVLKRCRWCATTRRSEWHSKSQMLSVPSPCQRLNHSCKLCLKTRNLPQPTTKLELLTMQEKLTHDYHISASR